MNDEKMKGALVAEGIVKAEWIDVNDHMNVAWYVAAFDLAVDALWTRFGITEEYIQSGAGSTFAVECHVIYRQELLEADPYIVTSQILAYDEKRIHQMQRLYHAEKHYLAATAEWMNLHVDLSTRKVSPWPDNVLAEIGSFAGEQPDTEMPLEICGRMRVRNPLADIYGSDSDA